MHNFSFSHYTMFVYCAFFHCPYITNYLSLDILSDSMWLIVDRNIKVLTIICTSGLYSQQSQELNYSSMCMIHILYTRKLQRNMPISRNLPIPVVLATIQYVKIKCTPSIYKRKIKYMNDSEFDQCHLFNKITSIMTHSNNFKE